MMTENEYLNSEIAANCPEEGSREIYRVHILRNGKKIEWASSVDDAEGTIEEFMQTELEETGTKPDRSEYTTQIEYQ